MTDFHQRLAQARDRIDPRWTEAREEATLREVRRAARRRTERRAVALGLSLCVVLVVLAVRFWPERRASVAGNLPREAPTAAPILPLLRLPDGTSCSALSPNARVEPLSVSPEAVVVRQTEGATRFVVTPSAGREFRVKARAVDIHVVGTVFEVGIERDGVRVKVEQGRVHVTTSVAQRYLDAGQSALFADGHDARKPETIAFAPEPERPSSDASADAPQDRVHRTSWRRLAEDGDYEAAYAELLLSGVRDNPGDLLLAADVARLSTHPDRAAQYLRKVLQRHATDSRAPLAAFTLGRILLDQLGRPHEAAEAFARTRRMAPSGALAQDALAREVESLARAGDEVRARERAEEYLSAYPEGRRRTAVRRYAGIRD